MTNLPNVERLSDGDARHQPIGSFVPGDVASGYYIDLRGVAGSYGPPAEAAAWLELLRARRERVMPVTVLQLGLGAWQRSIDLADADAQGWARIARDVATWAALDMDGHGRFIHHQPMPHTYRIPAPWWSAMAQGLGVSLLVRTGMFDDAERAVGSLLDPEHGLVVETEHGPVLQEYPADPAPDVLNGWMWALWGLYDISHAVPAAGEPGVGEATRSEAAVAFVRGIESLVAHLPAYETGRGWSTYDRYPHAIANVASPFYHRLHVTMLTATHQLAPRPRLQETAERWQAALSRPTTRATAVARKVGFRLVKPRRRAA